MSHRYYFKMFKNEPDVLTVPDVVRLLQFGKNTVYGLIKEGRISSIKQGKKIIVPKVCLVEFLTNAGNYNVRSQPNDESLGAADGCKNYQNNFNCSIEMNDCDFQRKSPLETSFPDKTTSVLSNHYLQTPSPTVPNNLWTYEDGCDSVGVAREYTKPNSQKKGA